MDRVIELGNDYTPILDFIGFIQGITLGIILLCLHKNKKKSCFYLGLFLILFSLKLMYAATTNIELSSANPEFFLLPVNFSWLLFALLFIYTQKVSIFCQEKIHYWILYPGLLVFLAQLVIYFQPYHAKLAIYESFWYEIVFTYSGIFYSWCIGIWNLIFIYLHRAEIRNSFSKLHLKKFQWIGIFLIYGLVSPVMIHLLYYLAPENSYYKIVFLALDIFAIYWISFHGIIQGNVQPIGTESDDTNELNNNSVTPKTELPILPLIEMQEIMKKIDDYMMNSEAFLHTDLSIMDLAKGLGLHPKRISTVINTVRHVNFNTYVNDLRIGKAKKLLKNDAFEYLSIEGIGNEAGFHSRSAFYTAFKKRTGTTPIRYREEILV